MLTLTNAPGERAIFREECDGTAAVTLLSRPHEQGGDAADAAYRRILGRIRDAEQSVEIHMYVWRADAVGHLIGEAVLQAAERGVKVRILKDSGAMLFETQESNRKPLFVKPRLLRQRIVQRLIGMTLPDSHVRDDWDQELGERLMAHPNVEFEWVSATHTKYYCVDETYLITGSLNLEDRHRGYHDIMIELTGKQLVRTFRRAQRTPSAPTSVPLSVSDEGRLDVLVNDPRAGEFAIKPEVLRLIESASERIHIEMAYVGDEDVTNAFIAAARRGVATTILFSEAANIGNDANFHTLRHLMEHADVGVRLSKKMIHSKLMLVDGTKALLGSANFSVFSMQRAGELSLLVENDEAFLREVHAVLAERWQLGGPVRGVNELPRYHRGWARLQQWHQRVSSHR